MCQPAPELYFSCFALARPKRLKKSNAGKVGRSYCCNGCAKILEEIHLVKL